MLTHPMSDVYLIISGSRGRREIDVGQKAQVIACRKRVFPDGAVRNAREMQKGPDD